MTPEEKDGSKTPRLKILQASCHKKTISELNEVQWRNLQLLCCRGNWCRNRDSSRALVAVLLLKSVDSSLCIEKLLLAGVERVALRAYTHTDLRKNRAGGEGISATVTINGYLLVGWVNVVFHNSATVLEGITEVNPRARFLNGAKNEVCGNALLRSDPLEYRSEFLSRPVTKVEQSVFLTVAYQY